MTVNSMAVNNVAASASGIYSSWTRRKGDTFLFGYEIWVGSHASE